jgi:hypothetical protein
VMLRVRRRITSHGGEDANAPEEWLSFFENGTSVEDDRDDALWVERKFNREDDGQILLAGSGRRK